MAIGVEFSETDTDYSLKILNRSLMYVALLNSVSIISTIYSSKEEFYNTPRRRIFILLRKNMTL